MAIRWSDLAPPRTRGTPSSKVFPVIREIHLDPFFLTGASTIFADGSISFISRSFHAVLLISYLDSLHSEIRHQPRLWSVTFMHPYLPLFCSGYQLRYP